MVSVTPDELRHALRRHRLVAIVRGSSTAAAEQAVRVLLAEGIALVEVALTTPGALGVIERVAADAEPGRYVGAGTVLTRGGLVAAVAAGACFVVTPGLAESVPAAVEAGVPVLCGAYTATEAIAAAAAGVTAVKLFPASAGGPAYLRALRDPLPDVPFVPVGGVGLVAARDYLRVGALAVGVGGPLVGDAASGGDLEALAERARGFVSGLRTGGGPA